MLILTQNFLPIQLFVGYRPGQRNFQVIYVSLKGTVNEFTGMSFQMYLSGYKLFTWHPTNLPVEAILKKNPTLFPVGEVVYL